MTILIEKSFERDINKIRSKRILLDILNLIELFQKANALSDIANIKKIQGYSSFYRIKISDYRIGLEKLANNTIVFLRALPRKDIYRFFPGKRI